jgi:general stress protein YciG
LKTPAQKRVETLKRRDPDFFKKIGKKGGKAKKSGYYFQELKESDPEKLEKISYRGGRRTSSPSNDG